MYLHKIEIEGFKNLESLKLSFDPKINCITGLNGSGKTNLLDSIYFLSMTKSYFSVLDSNSINFNGLFSRISGSFANIDNTIDTINVLIRRDSQKTISKNGKNYSKLSDHIGLYPIVMVSPFDTCLINNSSEERRKFMNYILSQTDRGYLASVQRYNSILSQRNKVLKDNKLSLDASLLDIYEQKMSNISVDIFNARDEMISQISPIVNNYYNILSDNKEEVSIIYKSELYKNSLSDLFQKNIEKDRALGFTTSGVHRDDMIYNMNGQSFKYFASQGQQKSFLVALKLAQYQLIRERLGVKPIMLLDDLFDKLDINRVKNLIKIVSSQDFGQVFITDSNKLRVNDIFQNLNCEFKSYEFSNGSLSI